MIFILHAKVLIYLRVWAPTMISKITHATVRNIPKRLKNEASVNVSVDVELAIFKIFLNSYFE